MTWHAALMADMHREALLEEAALDRRARLARGARPSVPAWRRALGSAAAALGRLLHDVAESLDPGVARNAVRETEPPCLDGGSAMAA